MKNYLILLCAMLIALTSCNTSPVDNDYKEARSLQKNGQYEVAFNQYAQISINTDAKATIIADTVIFLVLFKTFTSNSRI